MKRFTYLCFFIAIGLVFAASGNAAINPGTAAGVWLFDENNGAAAGDVSGNGNNGEVQNAEWVDGVSGSALSFNGTDARVVIPDADSLDLQEGWTITAWVFVNGSEGDYGHILAKRDDTIGGDANYCFRVDPTATGWEAYYWRDAWQGVWNLPAVVKDEWVYMTATYSPEGAGTITIYENAVEIGSGEFGGSAPAGASDVNIGGFANNSTELINGVLDEVALFGVALEVPDIEDLMNNGLEQALGITPVKPSGKLASTWGSVRASHR